MPSARLKWPEPRVTSATTSGTSTPTTAGERPLRRLLGLAAMGALGIDLAGANVSQRDQGRHQQQRGDEEDRAVRYEISARPHGSGRESVADRGEARVAAEALAHPGVTD